MAGLFRHGSPAAAAPDRKRSLLLTRYAVVAAAAAIVFLYGTGATGVWPVALLAAAALSNLVLHGVPERVLFAWWFLAPLLLADTAWIAATLLAAGTEQDVFLFYFLLLFLAALSENLGLLLCGAVLLSLASLAVQAGADAAGTAFVRVPFFFAAALFYGHLVQLARAERARSAREHRLAERLGEEVRQRTEELRRERAEARHLYERLLDAQRARAEFVANMSHEVRTPLNSIIGYADILAEEPKITADPELAQVVRRIASGGRALHQLLENLLAFARLERGEGTVVPSRFPLRRALEDLRRLAADLPVAETVSVSIEGPEQELLETDYARLQSILSNLLMNAVKFTRRGHVTVTAEVTPAEVRFRVEDTGIGMDERRLEHLFAPFEQADGSATRAFGGVGLGLAVVRRNVGLLGGNIEVHSRPGRGSVFTVTLPRRVAAQRAAPAGGTTVPP